MSNHLNFAPFFKAYRAIQGLALLGLLVFSGITNAAPITFQSANGNWSSYSYNSSTSSYAPSFIQGVGTAAVYWGEPYYSSTGPQESLVFQGNAIAAPVTPGSAFAIGWLSHANNAIYGDTNITSANLSLQLSLAGSNFNFNYNFDISQDPLTYTNTLTFSPVGGTQFSLGGQSYAFNLLGFYNQGNTYSNLIVEDGANANQIPLYASISTINTNTTPVPVPAALWLLGSGLIGLAGFAKKKRIHQ